MVYFSGRELIEKERTCDDYLETGVFKDRYEKVGRCYKKCKEESKLFSFGINGTNRCVNDTCECFCHKNVTKEKTCNQTTVASLNLYKVIEPSKP